MVSENSPADKAENDPIIEKSFPQGTIFLCPEKGIDMLGPTAQVTDAHRGCDSVSVDLPKAFDLDPAGQGGQGIRKKIVALG